MYDKNEKDENVAGKDAEPPTGASEGDQRPSPGGSPGGLSREGGVDRGVGQLPDEEAEGESPTGR